MPYAYCEQIGKEIQDISDEIPFDIPDNWEWCRVSDLFNVRSAMRIHQTDWQTNGIPFFRGRELVQLVNTGNVDFEIFISNELYESNKEKGGVPQKDDILVSAVGTLGKVYIVKGEKPFYYKDAYILCFENIGKIYPEYIKVALESPYLQNEIYKDSMATTVSQLTIIKAKSLLIPIPPLAEQHRIVSKIEELIPYIEKYGAAETKLSTLNTTFPEALKKSILQEAVQGKLVPQNPDDEPASVLLERIRAEKQALIKSGKIKKDNHESVIITRDKIPYEIIDGKERCIADEVPFELPEGWCWCRFGTAMVNRDAERIPLSVSEREKLDKIYDYYGASGVIDKVDRFLFDKPLLLIGEDGANLLLRSKPIAFIAKGQYWVNNHAHVLDTVGGLSMEYICVYINAINLSPYVTGTAQPKMNQEKMNSILVPIPPIEEQHRIVAKIEEIMPYINTISK